MDSALDRKKELASLGFSESEIQHLIGEWVNGYRKAMQEKSFNSSVEWPSEEEILNEIGKMSNPQRAVGFDLAINWLRDRIDKGVK